MEIHDLKKDCNRLIDRVVKLQSRDLALQERIEGLLKERELLTGLLSRHLEQKPEEGGREEGKMPAIAAQTGPGTNRQETSEVCGEISRAAAKGGALAEAEKQTPEPEPAESLTMPARSRLPAEPPEQTLEPESAETFTMPARNRLPVEPLEQTLEPEPAETFTVPAPGRSPANCARRLLTEQEETILKRQLGLDRGERDIVVVYGQTGVTAALKNLLKAGVYILLILLLTAAAALLLYYTEGV